VNERVGVLPWEVNKLYAVDLKRHGDKFVIRQPITFQNKRYFNLHRLLRAIDKNELLSRLPKEAQASEKETFVPPAQLLEVFRQHPVVVTNTYKLMDACNIEIGLSHRVLRRGRQE
jgi:DNA polymerase III alpha subunit